MRETSPEKSKSFHAKCLKKAANEVKRNIFLFDEVKKHSRKSPEIKFQKLNEKIRSTLPDQQINRTMPAKTQTKSSKKKLRN